MDFTNLLASLDCPICLQPLRKKEKSISPDSASIDREGNEESTEITVTKTNKNSASVNVNSSTAYEGAVNNGTADRSMENTSSTNSFQICWASDLLQRHQDLLEACDAESNGSEEDDGIALLVCGHLLHYSCALQMYEYQVNNHIGFNREVSTCPVCRSPLNGTEDIIPFHPCQRADHTYTHHINTLSTNASTLHNDKCDELDDAHDNTSRTEEMENEKTIVVSQRETSDTLENKLNTDNDTTITTRKVKNTTRKRQRSEETTDIHDNKEKETDARKLVVTVENVTIANGDNSSKSDTIIDNDNNELVDDSENDKSDEDDEESDVNDITLIGTRQRPYTEVYLEQLNRKSALITSRNAVLHDRERHLSRSLKELEEECNELNDSIVAVRLRAEILRKHGLTLATKNENNANANNNAQNDYVEGNHNNDGNQIRKIYDFARKEGSLDENKLRESASCFSPLVPSESELRKRKKFLRQMCVDTQRASQTATLQLANVLSESAHVRRQVDKYTYKLNKISALLHHTRNVTDCNEHFVAVV